MMSAKGRTRPSKRDVIVIDDDDTKQEQPPEKIVKEEPESVPSPDVAQLQEQLLKSDEKFKRVCEMAGEFKARVEFLENIIDSKEGILANANGAGSQNHLQQQASLAMRKIADLGYCFRNGKLRTIQGDQPYKFTTLTAYEELGELIDEVVYEMMEEAGLQRKYIVVGRNRRFCFVSPGYETKERILCIIHGSGEVKAGQWDMNLTIYVSLDRGTQLPYIRRALANGWGVVVLNCNEQCEGRDHGVGLCHAPERHAVWEWGRAFDQASDDAEIVVVAHAAGGAIISEVCRNVDRANDNRLLAVALTNSWFSVGPGVFTANWNTSRRKLHESRGVYQMYSGDKLAGGTSAAAINSIFAMLEGVSKDATPDEFRKLLEVCDQIIEDENTESDDYDDSSSVEILEDLSDTEEY